MVNVDRRLSSAGTLATALVSAFVATLGCTPAADEVSSGEQALGPELAPILGHLEDTTPESDFHAAELAPAQFPFVWHGATFPKATAVAATLGAPVTLAPGLADRAAVYTFAPGAEIEICAESAAARAKLWLYTTVSRGSSSCDGFVCNDPDELDETPRAKNVGDKVCTRGRIPRGSFGPHYVVVNLGPDSANATATVTTRAIQLQDSTQPDVGSFAASSCQGPALTVADVQRLGLAQEALSQRVGTYETAARTRSCNRFRGCTAWEPLRTDTLTLHGSCDGCIPNQWTNSASRGAVFVAWDDVSFGPYAKVMLFPDGTAAAGAASSRNHVSCDLSLSVLSTCSAAGDWNSAITLGETKLAFASAKDSAFTAHCMRTVARAPVPRLASEYVDTEVAFHGDLSL